MYREISPTFFSPELDETDSFMVVILRSSGGALFGDEGGRVGVAGSGADSGKSGRDVERMWILVQDTAGGVAMLEHHVGRFLCAEPDGKVSRAGRTSERPVGCIAGGTS
jgi:hypothetical protein